MRYLLDTQVLIFLGCGYEKQIGRKALEIYRDADSEIYINQISFWEMSIKINIGKLHIPIGLERVMESAMQAGIKMMPVENSHILSYQSLEIQRQHKDPFDRYLVSVAICEKMSILSNDTCFDLYKKINRIWD